jgi:hypothetical protein
MSEDGSAGEVEESEWTWDCSGERPKRVRRRKVPLWGKAESGKASPCTLSACGGEGGERYAGAPVGGASADDLAGRQAEEIPELPEAGLGTEGHADRGEGLKSEENELGERQAEIVSGKEAPQSPAGNTEAAGVAGKAPKEEALPGGEIPQREKEPWRYDPYEVSRKIREAEKARRMRRRQIDV